jgi:methionyl-tRNA formyltransferase
MAEINTTRIVFMGTPGFAVPSLKILLDAGYNVAAVVTSPDKPSGRGRNLQSSAVKEFAISKNIPVLQPENLKENSFLHELKQLNPDIQVVVAFRMLPEVVWRIPALGTFNLHASLLPQYRGAAPINHVLINGEEITGVTTFFIDNQIDTGKIIMQQEVQISPEENAGSLHDKLMMVGASAVLKTVGLIEQGNVSEISQASLISPGEILKAAPKIFKEDCNINWEGKGRDIVNFIRGLSPYPAAYTTIVDKKGEKRILKIYDAAYRNELTMHPPGTIKTDSKEYLAFAAVDGYVSVLSLQLEGKSRMDVKSFLAGYREFDDK